MTEKRDEKISTITVICIISFFRKPTSKELYLRLKKKVTKKGRVEVKIHTLPPIDILIKEHNSTYLKKPLISIPV